MNFDAEVSNFITKLLNEETPHENNPPKEYSYIQDANEKQVKTTLNIKQKYQDLKLQYDFQLSEINRLTTSYTDIKAQLMYSTENFEKDKKNQLAEFNQKISSFQQITKQKIDQLLIEKEQLAVQNTDFAKKYQLLQVSLNDKVFDQNKDLNNQFTALKLNFDQKLQNEKQKLKRKFQTEFEEKQSSLLKQAENDLAVKIEPQINNIVASHKLKIQQLNADFTDEKLKMQQSFNEKLQFELENQRKILIQQNIQEQEQVLKQQYLNANKQVENAELHLNFKIRQINENNELNIANLRKQNSTNLENARLEFSEKETKFQSKIDILERQGVKLADDFQALKAKMEAKYNTELQEIRGSYREFAVQLFKQQKQAILNDIKEQQTSQIKKIIIDVESQNQIEMQQKSDEYLEQKLEFQRIIANLQKNFQEGQIDLLQVRNELEMIQKQLNYKNHQLVEISTQLETKLGVNIEIQQGKNETLKMATEDQYSTIMMFVIRQNTKEKEILGKVKNQIQGIVSEKDQQIGELKQQIGLLRLENQKFQVMLMDLEDVSLI
ncbi:hypothetical protein SS50377_24815 [Spironucleus salmonicida]|uniref:Uncharacterized protein n=1 Tax=Spironucleus salmonicida TaxID=348837 RepID=V6LJN6_9EUKA|nr:hypothetical protein SS50377_24815 [Spironucleus salmonicida]|eukprot:EST44737.1 Hypothetical protein SS50377_15357 [Spironucleus salmonicida]